MNNTNLANYLIYLHVSLVFSRIFLIINFEHECHEFDELIYIPPRISRISTYLLHYYLQ